MDNQRTMLWAGLALVLFFIYQAWMKDYGPAPAPAPALAGSDVSVPLSSTEPGGGEESDIGLPQISAQDPATGQPQDSSAAPREMAAATESGKRIRVQTDVLDLYIDTLGGAMVYAAIKRYPVEKTRPDEPIVLLNTNDEYFVAQSGLRGTTEGEEPNHRATWVAERAQYELADGDAALDVTLRWESAELEATKTFRFTRGGYRIDVETRLRNKGSKAWVGASYMQLIRDHREVKRSFTSVDSYSYLGPAVFDGEKYDKLDAGDLEEGAWRVTGTGGWLALIQHHFLVAAVPVAGEAYQLEARLLDSDRFLLRAVSPAQEVAPGGTGAFKQTFFVGPKLQKQLSAVGPKLSLTVDYGLTTIIAQPLFWVLNKIHSFVGNWGWAIILLTLLIKLVFYKLAETSGRSMAKMRKLQPRMKILQERYKDDRQKLSQAMMELYKQEKANPAAGCLPLLVQMPVFFALYWALIESVELRQAPWMLWINDLSSKDPYFILPVLMGASMFFMQKLNPQPTDPIQAKVMLFMPVMMGGFMAFFPSGLVLYWLVNNLLSIAQQWRINKVVEAER